MKDHWLDKPILRELFWSIVLPHRLAQWLSCKAKITCACNRESGSRCPMKGGK